MNVLIVGAGLFGCNVAEELAKHGYDVTIIDKESDIMLRASRVNHNRLHLGFHYPRSVETAVQSVNGLLSFTLAYKDAIVSDFPNHYAIAKEGSKVNAQQFAEFCDEVGLFYKIEMPDEELINHDFIETSFTVNEPTFDYSILQQKTRENINKYPNIKLKLNTAFSPEMADDYDYIINASYESINTIHESLGVSSIPLRLQDVVIPIIEMPMDRVGLTIMDGPFCSIMPKGFEKNRFLLYHVVESVLEQVYEGELNEDTVVDYVDFVAKSKVMYPILEKAKVVDNWRTVRALPINNNDARVSELFYFEEKKNLITVLSGKISTCRKLAMEIYLFLETGKHRHNIVS